MWGKKNSNLWWFGNVTMSTSPATTKLHTFGEFAHYAQGISRRRIQDDAVRSILIESDLQQMNRDKRGWHRVFQNCRGTVFISRRFIKKRLLFIRRFFGHTSRQKKVKFGVRTFPNNIWASQFVRAVRLSTKSCEISSSRSYYHYLARRGSKPNMLYH